MANHRKAQNELGHYWCPRCKTFKPENTFARLSLKRIGTHKRATPLQTWCRQCQREKRIEWHNKPESHLRELVRKTKTRGRISSLTSEWALAQFAKQEGRCFYTGIKMTIGHGKGRIWTSVSIDRRNNNADYLPQNCVLCCSGFNLMKHTLPLHALIQIARELVKRADLKLL